MAFCAAADAYLTISVEAEGDAVTSLRISLHGGRNGSQCDDVRPAGRRAWEEWVEEVVPALEPPEEASVLSMGSGGSDNYREIRARIDTELAAEALVDHYAGQLVAAGWVAGGTVTTSRAAVADVSLEASEERAVVGFLFAHCGHHTPTRAT